MAKRAIKSIVTMFIICFGLIVAIPILILSNSLSQYDTIDTILPFYYDHNNSSFMKSLNIDSDFGDVDIEYISEPVDYYVKLEIKMEMMGLGLAGKTYSDYFNIVWQNTSSSINFSMNLKTFINPDEVLPLLKRINIAVFIKNNITADINVNVNIEGDVTIIAQSFHSVGNLSVNVTKGNIQYDFFNCMLEGNVTGIIRDAGGINMKTSDVFYTNYEFWSLYTNNGDVLVNISQTNPMNANVTGVINAKTGNYLIFYKDNISSVGAYYVLYINPNDYGINQKIVEMKGFEYYVSAVNGTDVYHIKSDNYPAQFNYNLLFDFPIGKYKELVLENT